MKILVYFILFIIILFIIILFYLPKFFLFTNSYLEHFEVTHLKPECYWSTQGILRCNEVPTIENIPSKQIENKIN
jgi:hypothetical protein